MNHDRPYLDLIEEFDPEGKHLRGKAIEHIYLSAINVHHGQRIEHLRRAGAYLKRAIDQERRQTVRDKALGDWEKGD